MKGSEAKMLGFMEGADKRYVIPVYQRKYDWKLDNCRQLYEDLRKIIIDNRPSHFFGSVVSAVVPNGSKIEYHIIDGQQRLTTVTLLLLAMRNLIKKGKIKTSGKLDEQINDRFITAPWASEDDKIKLRPVKSDKDALTRLFGDEEDYDFSSNMTLNYQFFYEKLQTEDLHIEDIFAAIGKLEIISITLDPGDNAQLIFESLNSTGLALSEGDKIRNYVLMSLPPQDQTKYFDTYWAKIEKCTSNDVSGFIRDYLSIKQQVTPTINNVYKAFKCYAETLKASADELLTDMLRYARYFEKLLTCKSGLNEQKLDDCLYRMMRLEIVVTRPFLMEVLRLNHDGKLSAQDVLKIFLTTEIYLFRRNICEVPTNALNKVFLNLHREIMRYDSTVDNYVGKFIYSLLAKKESGRFPDDDEFKEALTSKQVYLMRGKYKNYLFERFENYGTVETKDVYTHLDKGTYTIEHIMPQHLTPTWTAALGVDFAEIHSTWLHRLANLTLTGYNPNLSNHDFLEKRDAKIGGYKISGLKMNQKIAAKDSWGLTELEERNTEMIALALDIWGMPETDFVPAEKEFDSCSLDDENIDLTGKDIVKYSYQASEQSVPSWIDMFEHVIKFLHHKDKSVLISLIHGSGKGQELLPYISDAPENLRTALYIDENIYVEKNTSTALKMTILRRIFALFDADPMDLVFYFKERDASKNNDGELSDIRKEYWSYALPIIQKQHMHRGTFGNCNPTPFNTLSGFFGISGFCIICVANSDDARIDFYLGNSDTVKNKSTFDMLFSHKKDIEQSLGINLLWERADEYKASWISYHLPEVGVMDKASWMRMAEFHAEWSDKICNVILPFLLDKETMHLTEISGVFREWSDAKEEINLNLAKCNRTYTRFTTPGMTAILPDIKDAPSGWNTENHYFYEIVNRSGKEAFIQLSISSKNITAQFRGICDEINRLYPVNSGNDEWQYRVPFKTSTITIGSEEVAEDIFDKLDTCLAELLEFEKALAAKMQN